MKNTRKKCQWLNQKGNPCSWSSLENKLYCKRHSIHEGIYLPEDIPNLQRCSGCRNLFKKNGNKSCDKCKSRIKPKKKINIRKCQGKTIKGMPCQYKALENDDYCKNHKSYKKWIQLTNLGKKVCYQWIRGCFNIIEDEHSNCYICREKIAKKRYRKTTEKTY
jgi:hypothetical protein